MFFYQKFDEYCKIALTIVDRRINKEGQMKIEAFYDKATFTLTYVVFDPASKDAVVIDSVLDFDPNSSQYSFESLDKLTQFLKDQKFNLKYILETHVHADHLTGALELKHRFPGAKMAIGSQIRIVQETFQKLYNIKMPVDGDQFDHLLSDNEEFMAGTIKIKTLTTPGHTPACCSFLIEDNIFTGDCLFMPDFGTGRCDFPKGSAGDLYKSVMKLYALPDNTKVFVGHDYCPGGRELKYESTIGDEKENNIWIQGKTQEEAFVEKRSLRDKELQAPRLLFPSIQINMNGGQLPDEENNNMRYLKIPFIKKDVK